MEEKLAMRNEVPAEETWDLSLIYASDEDMQKDIDTMLSLAELIKIAYPGKLDNVDNILDCLELYRKIREIMCHVEPYALLAVEVDYYDNDNQDRASRVGSLMAKVRSELSFIESEIAAQPEAVIREAIEKADAAKGYLTNILREKPHLLHPEAERVMKAMAPTIGAPYDLYNTIKLADIRFDNFEAGGRSYPLGYSLFEDNYEYEPDTEIRRAAFRAFSDKIKAYENGTAAAFNAHVQQEKIEADLRGFESMTHMNLFHDKVTPELYHRQIDLIMEKLAPHMRKYAKLLQKIYGLETMTYADLKLPVDPDYSPAITIAQSRDYIEKGLAIMGEDYGAMIREAYDNRWVDFARNQGKCTGGFCESPYRRGSFILMSWNGKMSDVCTLAHELGHAGHFKLCGDAQSVLDQDVSTYFVEAPSTINELLMSHYLLTSSDDPRFRRWVLANMVGNTYYHNFVTHLLEGAYQREVYKIVEEGGSVQADTLSDIFREVLTKFWGDAVELTPGAELTWMRQPHYYMGLYSYSYSAGLTVATQMCKMIEKEGAPAVERWKKVLSAGSTLDPMGLAALAGIDLSTDEPLLDTIETIGGYIDEICRLTEEIFE